MDSKMPLSKMRTLYREAEGEMLADFFSFLRFQSVSSERKFKPQMASCVNWLCEYIAAIGFDTEIWRPDDEGHPILFASWMHAGADKPTLLIYNHYDVQPVDPLELWQSDPFEPTVREGKVYARGAQDNKGQCFYVLQALKLLMRRDGALPINVKLCIEGEEECGSRALATLLNSKRQQLAADYLAIVDLGIPAPESPALTLGLRGIVTLDVAVAGASGDMHSGTHGGILYNPLHALLEMLAKLRDERGKIAVPGFYDSALIPCSEELQKLDLTFDGDRYEKLFGAKPSGGEKSYSPIESNWLRPTLEINGVSGGYTGEGFKTIIPARADAKISCRLVPEQDPRAIAALIAEFLKLHCPEGVTLDVSIRPGVGRACRTSPNSSVIKAFGDAFEELFGSKCQYTYSGASIPIATDLAAASGGEIALLGLGLEGDNIHAPNEHFGIDRLEKGCLIAMRALENLVAAAPSSPARRGE